jgi:putative FmdB family regulatory protein
MARTPASQAGNTVKLWDFQCLSCDHKFEAMARQSDIDDHQVACPKCDGFVKKLLTIGCVDSHAAASWRR